jgi:hypothetical protein
METMAIAETTSSGQGRGRRGRFKITAGILLALLPVTGGVAFFLLQLMGSAAAGVTGGCGGG